METTTTTTTTTVVVVVVVVAAAAAAAGRSDHRCEVGPESVCVAFAQTDIFVCVGSERRRNHACDLYCRFGFESPTFFAED
jgi:hypothetical protein